MNSGTEFRPGHVMWRTLLEAHRDGRQSLQAQVRQMLVAAMLDGLLPEGHCLPSTRELADALGVSRNTVILVYQQLVDDGYATTRERHGYYVSAQARPRQAAGAAPPPATARLLAEGATPSLQRAVPGAAQVDWNTRLHFRPTQQRNIEKPAQWRDYPYPFLYGQFDAPHFPTADWRQCCLRALGQLEVHDWGQDMFLRDDASLIQQIRTRLLPQRGIRAAEDEVMLTVGAQHGLYLLADLLTTAHTTVGIEEPGYPDARNIFGHRGASIRPLPVDASGLVVGPALAGCALIYTTPSHHCPTTVTLPLARREALLSAAAQHDFLIIEDDYETQSHQADAPVPALKSLDRHGRVVYIGSLSKSLAPGLRTGYVVGPAPLLHELRAMRRLNLRHPNAFIQRAVALFLGLGHHHALLRKQAELHAERAQALARALHTHMPQCRFTPQPHGSAFWVQGPAGLDARALAQRAEPLGVLIEPGDVFFQSPAAPCAFFRMGFTSIAASAIDEGVRRLAQALQQLPEHRAAAQPH